ncbi:profilin-2 [Conidiobolus coronatus NRRL 28638]|uniref:Profilin n=1 Tax=Conidiobolus coronatus (strain ATCC 28846 / CBS 209.66 / NRRL 28638) TaxID=796925 RepID=A0A137PEG4_CONC2|nr:profilin-2 [Conidiobolus coronatus NRRL 28638]|eukprot:KXN73393.1 profilin-2 [Conidiobolus coronatus NRRL 28638]
MSWQAYVDTSLIGTGKVSKAAIIGHDGNTWATSAGFTVSPAEGAAIANGYTDANSIRGSGIHLNGEKYFTLRADDRSIYGKQGNNGVSIVKTTQAILIGVYESPIQPGESATEVEKLADYLISVGY